MKWKNHNVQDVEVELVLQGLKQRYGYDFTGYARASLKRRLLELSQSFEVSHLSELLPLMLYDEVLAREMINRITVPTSEFFRDPQLWRRMRELWLPQLAGFPWINIWQVGCGLGEETYTLALLLHEVGLLRRARIFTTDINSEFLRQAKQGCWSETRFDLWHKNYLNSGGQADFEAYFQTKADCVVIDEQFKKNIEFVQHNLVADEVFKEVQWVVCRNVLIYFGADLQARVINLFERSLERGGVLMLGHAERILDTEEQHPSLSLVDPMMVLYRKID